LPLEVPVTAVKGARKAWDMVPRVEVDCVIGCNASLNVLSGGGDDISRGLDQPTEQWVVRPDNLTTLHPASSAVYATYTRIWRLQCLEVSHGDTLGCVVYLLTQPPALIDNCNTRLGNRDISGPGME